MSLVFSGNTKARTVGTRAVRILLERFLAVSPGKPGRQCR